MQKTTTTTITKRLSFYKENGLWYADLPGFLELGLGSKANLLMVDGSDRFLDLLSSNGSKVTVKLTAFSPRDSRRAREVVANELYIHRVNLQVLLSTARVPLVYQGD